MSGSSRAIAAACRKVFLTLCLSALLSPTLTEAQSQMQKPLDIVLVHGAFADGSSWSRVISLLQKKGHHVTAVQNPLTSFAADVAITTRVIDRQPHDVLLVGHSWGGVVVTEAGNHVKVKGLVYLSALVPDSDESAGQLLERLHSPMEGMAPDENGLVWLDDPRAFAKVMAGDVASDDVLQLAAVQQPIAVKVFSEKVGHAAWHDKPSWYLVTKGDRALPPPVQKKIAAMTGAHTVEVRSSHMSLVSHPDAVADLIDQAARALR